MRGAEYLISKRPKLKGVIKQDKDVPKDIVRSIKKGIINKFMETILSKYISAINRIGILIVKLKIADKIPASNIMFLSNWYEISISFILLANLIGSSHESAINCQNISPINNLIRY